MSGNLSNALVHENSTRRIASGNEAIDVLSRFVSAIEYTPLVAIQSIDRTGIVRFWNSMSTTIYGIPAREAIGRRLSDLLQHQDKEPEFADTIDHIWQTGQAVLPRDWQITTSAGANLWVYSTMFPVFREKKIHQIFCMDIDITLRKREEQALLALGANFRTLFDRSADAILLIEDNYFLEVNPAALTLFGYARKSDLVGRNSNDISPTTQPDGKPSSEKFSQMLELAHQNGNYRFDWLHVNASGETFWTEVLCTEIPIDSKALLYIVVRDIRERKHAEQSLQLAAQVFENSQEGILIADMNQRIVSINRALSDITGYTIDEVVGKEPQSLCVAMRDKAQFKTISDEVHAHDRWQGELWGRHCNGRGFPLWLSISVVRDSHRNVVNYIAIMTDISDRKASEEQMRHMAEHDFLTGLPNRVLLLDRLQQAIAVAERNAIKLALLFLDLDRFKHINDSFGHHVGDKLLQAIAERLTKCVRAIDTVSRLGGDEFVIMLVDVGRGEPISHIADNVLNAVSMPYSIDGNDFIITTCIGISTYPNDGTDMDTLIKNADTAMYHAKGNGTNRYQFFDDEMNRRVVERTLLENSLRSALKSSEFVLEYQPQMDMRTGQIVGVEALIRWAHPALGLMLPSRFIAVAEECGLIVPIGDWVMRTACLQAKAWQDNGHPLVVSVNLSVAQFHQKSLLKSIVDALQQAQLAPQFLELEITESILMDEAKGGIDTLRVLRNIGIRLAIDDFGTGFSSLSYLKRIPINKLKIDQSFVRDITVDPEDAVIINAIIVMAKSLNLTVIAEGVETQEQYRFLQAHGCDEYQGYYSSKALTADMFARQFLQPS
ncbi:sensor domain-containing protein [Actimicrobium antarcticum]|uniref:sensor domain-containing protein n=1 Tax=Actimicrobium antarcticum TaxID=1051899 RepID=UPI0031DBBB76